MMIDILQIGAKAFVVIVVAILAFVAWLTTIDYLKTKEKEGEES